MDALLAESFENIDAGFFYDLVNNYPEQKEYLKQIEYTESDISTSYEIVEKMYEEKEISETKYRVFNSITDAYKEYPFQFSELKLQLDAIEESVENKDISKKEKEDISAVLEICKASVEYWNNDKNINKAELSKGSVPWYTKDAVGAMTGVQTGLVGYANLIVPGWGGAVALVGSAALSSCI